jgi:hypothetical protein
LSNAKASKAPSRIRRWLPPLLVGISRHGHQHHCVTSTTFVACSCRYLACSQASDDQSTASVCVIYLFGSYSQLHIAVSHAASLYTVNSVFLEVHFNDYLRAYDSLMTGITILVSLLSALLSSLTTDFVPSHVRPRTFLRPRLVSTFSITSVSLQVSRLLHIHLNLSCTVRQFAAAANMSTHARLSRCYYRHRMFPRRFLVVRAPFHLTYVRTWRYIFYSRYCVYYNSLHWRRPCSACSYQAAPSSSVWRCVQHQQV